MSRLCRGLFGDWNIALYMLQLTWRRVRRAPGQTRAHKLLTMGSRRGSGILILWTLLYPLEESKAWNNAPKCRFYRRPVVENRCCSCGRKTAMLCRGSAGQAVYWPDTKSGVLALKKHKCTLHTFSEFLMHPGFFKMFEPVVFWDLSHYHRRT